VQASKGGARPVHLVASPAAIPETRPHRLGVGDSEQDLLARAREIYRHAPVVQSEDLIIERLVKPEYPEDAKNRNIEGHVALVALVDTAGEVVSVDLMGSTGERQLEKAATEAVWQCRFRPYKVAGEVHEVYAVFRFAFRIY
jgi:TonB family protein